MARHCAFPASSSSCSTRQPSASWSPMRSCTTDSSYPRIRRSPTSCAAASRTGTATSNTRYPENPYERRKPMTDVRAAGLEVFKEMLPGLIPDDATTLRDDGVAGELLELGLDHVFGSLWTRPGLARRPRSLVTLGALIALRASEELKAHFPIALRNGLTIDEIGEVIYHMTGYAGYPAAASARAVARDVLANS